MALIGQFLEHGGVGASRRRWPFACRRQGPAREQHIADLLGAAQIERPPGQAWASVSISAMRTEKSLREVAQAVGDPSRMPSHSMRASTAGIGRSRVS